MITWFIMLIPIGVSINTLRYAKECWEQGQKGAGVGVMMLGISIMVAALVVTYGSI